eukprot:2791794-Rhodomonas_salina.5
MSPFALGPGPAHPSHPLPFPALIRQIHGVGGPTSSIACPRAIRDVYACTTYFAGMSLAFRSVEGNSRRRLGLSSRGIRSPASFFLPVVTFPRTCAPATDAVT